MFLNAICFKKVRLKSSNGESFKCNFLRKLFIFFRVLLIFDSINKNGLLFLILIFFFKLNFRKAVNYLELDISELKLVAFNFET